MSAAFVHPASGPRLQVRYAHAPSAAALLAPDVLAVIGFGAARLADDGAMPDPRCLRVGLAAHGDAPFEVWHGAGPVRARVVDGVRLADDGHLQVGVIEVDEAAHGGIRGAAKEAYARLQRIVGRGEDAYPHLLRIWNYIDAITDGDGDDERYRQFCVGRALGFGTTPLRFPAATAIGRHDGRRVLQVYWIGARQPGTPVENPRQVAAYRYPRQYGPQPPSFARAMLAAQPDALPLMLSGTAAVVGHASRHPGDLAAQLDETLANFDALLGAARQHAPGLPAGFGPSSPLKAYVREPADLPRMAALLAGRLPPGTPHLLLHGEVCRRELLVEIDGFHGP
jgi:chorismate lyase/3-hydroxybenzoate synthase